MHIGKSYALPEFIRWTRRKSYILIAVATTQVGAYQLLGWHWLAMPWAVAALLGTAASFIVGFKNAQTYNRTSEAQQIWSSIASSSRYWGLISRDFPKTGDHTQALIGRHLAWLTAVRYQLRQSKVWEAAANQYNFEYRERSYSVAEHAITRRPRCVHIWTSNSRPAWRAPPALPTPCWRCKVRPSRRCSSATRCRCCTTPKCRKR